MANLGSYHALFPGCALEAFNMGTFSSIALGKNDGSYLDGVGPRWALDGLYLDGLYLDGVGPGWVVPGWCRP
eukprot:1161469-Pelagomonas_calceolata.AAC.49